jgi:hypothetical protein
VTSRNGSIADTRDPKARFRVHEDDIVVRPTNAGQTRLYIVPTTLRRVDTPNRYHLLREHGTCQDGVIVCRRNFLVMGYVTDDTFRLEAMRFHSHGAYSGTGGPVGVSIRELIADAVYKRSCRWAS